MNKQRGFKLLEVIVASAVFFTVAILFLNLLPASFWARKNADNQLTASTLASSHLEDLRLGRFSDLVVGFSTPVEVRQNKTHFQVVTEIREVPSRDPDLLKHVLVEVSWRERSGPKSFLMESYISAVRR